MEINVNGQVYSRWEDVPVEVRQQLAATLPDHDRNGIPDLVEGNLSALPGVALGDVVQTFFSVDGRTVSSVGELPPDVQQLLRQAFGWPLAAAATAATAAPPPPTTGDAPPPPGQVVLNGVPTTVEKAVAPEKPWWKRIFGR